VAGQQGMTGGEWHAYSGDLGSTKYSSLGHIDRDNVGDLELVWRWSSPDNRLVEEGSRKRIRGFTSTPLVVDGVMYAITSLGLAAAIDPASGATLWLHDPGVWKGAQPTNLGFNMRGLAFWKDDEGAGRVVHGSNDGYLWQIDAATGRPVETFGEQGRVDLVADLRRPLARRNFSSVSPPVICRGAAVVGSSINDRPTHTEMTPGDVRAYDVRTGELRWTFHNPPAQGEPGYETWEQGSADHTGNANVWTHMSCDEELGLVYLPFGTPTNDFYGGHRHGKNLYAESLVAVHADTGELAWYFQHVHHGLWDWDLPTAPALVDVVVDGRPVSALAQVTKQGFLWVLDRRTGEPVWPIEERPVPQTTVEGEKTWPTQPFPTKPAPFTYQGSTPDLLIDFTPELRAEAMNILEQYNYGPIYTPPLEEEAGRPTIVQPGWGGGGNWQGCAVDPESGLVFVPSVNNRASTYSMAKPDPARSNFSRIGKLGRGPQGPDGLPLWKPPYSHVTAIDLKTGEHAWDLPLGDGPRDHPRLAGLDLPPMGSMDRGFVVATSTLLLVLQGGEAPTLRGVDKATGDVLAEVALPASPSGSPITYRVGDRQFVTFAAQAGRRGPAELLTLGLP
jgi:quinoprotein glucose dehydrogenase